ERDASPFPARRCAAPAPPLPPCAPKCPHPHGDRGGAGPRGSPGRRGGDGDHLCLAGDGELCDGLHRLPRLSGHHGLHSGGGHGVHGGQPGGGLGDASLGSEDPGYGVTRATERNRIPALLGRRPSGAPRPDEGVAVGVGGRWRRLARRNSLAAFAGGVVAVMLLASLLAPWLAPYDSERGGPLPAPSATLGAAPVRHR